MSALGDTVCCLPVAAALKQAFPQCEIDWIVDPRFAGVVECCTAVDHVLALKPSLTTWKQVRDTKLRYAAAFDLQGLLKSAAFVGAANADAKLGYHWQREGAWLFSSRVLPDPSSFHVVDQYVDVARAAGARVNDAHFALKPREEDVLAVRQKLKAKEVYGRFVIINAGAGWASKRWPASHFAQLIDSLGGRQLPSVLIGGKADADTAAAKEVIDRCHHKPANLLGETNVRELIALIRLASAHVGGDTGSTHIAAALEVPAIGLYSITNPKRSCPYGQIDRCHYDPTGLANIPVADVLHSVLSAVESA